MKRFTATLSITAIAIAGACTDANRNPVAPPTGPSFSIGTGAHFQSASDALDGASLVATFEEAGLGNTVPSITVQLTANATALYACQNGGGNFPTDPKKKSESSIVRADVTAPVENGHASGQITVDPPASTLNCPGGQHPVLVSVSYTKVKLTDLTDNIFTNLANQAATFFTL